MLSVLLLSTVAGAIPAPVVSDEVLQTAEKLRDAALVDDTAYRFVESLTTEVGPRLAGTKQEARAREWAVAKLKALGFRSSQISVEPFRMQTWVRGAERAHIETPFPQPMVVTALGRSGSTGPRGLKGRVQVYKTIGDLERAPAREVRGKVVYIGHAMRKTQDGSSYGYFGRARFVGPSIAAKKGAKAVMIRSVGTHSHRLPHTGVTGWPKQIAPVPAIALSPPDADQVERIHDLGKPISVSMTVTPRILGTTTSGNVVVDIKGREKPEEIVIIGGHLDSWDLGTGAVDDGAGVAITTGALNLIRHMKLQPRRTIRLVLWGAEEVGLNGAKAYAERHAAELDQHVLGSESDFGAREIFRLHAHVSSEGSAVIDEMLRLMAPLGVGPGTRGNAFKGGSGPDLSPLNRRGLPRVHLAQDGRDYFDLHHTPDDTFDKIDPRALAQNVAAYAVFVWLAANTEVDFRPGQDPNQLSE